MKYMHHLSNYYASSWKQMKTQNETFGTFQRPIETLCRSHFDICVNEPKLLNNIPGGKVEFVFSSMLEMSITSIIKVMIVMKIRTCTKSKYVI